MPYVKVEHTIYPDDLLIAEQWRTLPTQWWACHTKSRTEKRLADYLFAQKVAFYLPLTKVLRTSRCLKRRSPDIVHRLLFPGYIFIAGNATSLLTALKSDKVVHMLEVPSAAVPGFVLDLAAIQQAIASGVNPYHERHKESLFQQFEVAIAH